MIKNDYKFDVTKLLDLSLLKINDLKYNFFANNDQFKVNFKNQYIETYVSSLLSKNKPKNIKNKYFHDVDYDVFITFSKDLKLNIKEENVDENLKIFLNNEKYQSIIIQIIAKENSYLLKNQATYQIINDPDDTIAPPEPEIIDKKDILKENLMWIIPSVIGGVVLISLIIFFTIKRFKRKIR